MKIKTFQVNKNNLIEMNPEALQDLLDEAYKEGYEDGKRCAIVSYPYTPVTTPYGTYSVTYTGGETK